MPEQTVFATAVEHSRTALVAIPAASESESPEKPADWFDWLLRAAIILALAAIVIVAFRGRIFEPLVRSATLHGWAVVVVRPSVIWILMGTVLLVFRTALWFYYRPFAPANRESAPNLTVIIPAYNEGAMVAHTIDSVAGADYPHDRLEIFVVDDGSRDDTWEHIERAAQRHPDIVTALRFPENRGKRAALAAGFRRARGEVVVTIDSDCAIEKTALLAIAGPFREESVGAVAGKVSVYNRRQGLIPRMLHIRFTLSFDMLRAIQSTYRTVYCCPGALSAYRLSVVRRVLQRWESQSFLGVPSTYGEDRSMTNFILDAGYDTVYQRSAVVHTIVPQTYRKLCKMYLRWERSYIREELRFALIVWKRPLKSMLVSLVDSTITNLRYPVGYAILLSLIALTISDPTTFVRMLVAICVMASFYMLYYLRSERSWDIVYGVLYAYFSFFALFWIFPYALLTVRSRGWLTR
ncbi:MAG TPA: glycosyltransferase [Burkholderiales bacterium]